MAVVQYLQTAFSAADGVTYTFSSQSLGTESADRYIAVAISSRKAGAATNLNSVTIAGVTAKIISSNPASSTDSGITAIAIAPVPNGTTGNIAITFGATMVRASVSVYRLTGIDPNNFALLEVDGASQTGSISVEIGGVTIGVATMQANNAYTWTGLTENYDNNETGEATYRHTAASTLETATTTKTVTASTTGGTAESAMSVVSFRLAKVEFVGSVGNNTSVQTNSTDRKYVSSLVPAANGKLKYGGARVFLSGAGTSNARLVVYRGSSLNGAPLVATSDQVTITNTTEALVRFPFSGDNRIDFVAGEQLYGGIHFSDPGTPNFTISRANALGQVFSNPDVYADGASAIFDGEQSITASNGPLDVFFVIEQNAIDSIVDDFTSLKSSIWTTVQNASFTSGGLKSSHATNEAALATAATYSGNNVDVILGPLSYDNASGLSMGMRVNTDPSSDGLLGVGVNVNDYTSSGVPKLYINFYSEMSSGLQYNANWDAVNQKFMRIVINDLTTPGSWVATIYGSPTGLPGTWTVLHSGSLGNNAWLTTNNQIQLWASKMSTGARIGGLNVIADPPPRNGNMFLMFM